MTPEQEEEVRKLVKRVVASEAKLIARMMAGRAEKWIDFILSEIKKDKSP